ncbi:hypothetical protein E2C01_087614 [Portunus trituberculatus]|uniref:Uncharacterized protein n=1 Tax=Portunus trituberculatus TaxID=210409 RepID=A0A5B7J3U9_PORTR|nr:hypothetical protein [Portunus trituberculatus]
MKGRMIQGKYEIFLQKYNKGVNKYISIYRVKKSIHALYSARCIKLKMQKIKLGRNSKNKEIKITGSSIMMQEMNILELEERKKESLRKMWFEKAKMNSSFSTNL